MLRDLAALIRHPLHALRHVDLDRRLSQGLVALLLSVGLPALTSELAALGPFRPAADLGSLPSLTAQAADLYARWTYAHRFVLPLIGILISLAFWLLAAGLIHGVARALRGQGSFVGFLKLTGYVALIGLLALPVDLLDAGARLSGNMAAQLRTGQLSGLVGLAMVVWQNILLVYAARQHYKISTERAVAAVIGPIASVIVLAFGLLIAIIILYMLNQTV